MNISDITAKLTRQHDRGLITSDDYLRELESAMRELRSELTDKYTLHIIEDGEVTELFVEYRWSCIETIIEQEICPSVFGCTDSSCPSKHFARSLKTNGVAMFLKRDEDGLAARHKVYTAHRL